LISDTKSLNDGPVIMCAVRALLDIVCSCVTTSPTLAYGRPFGLASGRDRADLRSWFSCSDRNQHHLTLAATHHTLVLSAQFVADVVIGGPEAVVQLARQRQFGRESADR
jgi:hypothetical protein